eukprot:g577.t1
MALTQRDKRILHDWEGKQKKYGTAALRTGSSFRTSEHVEEKTGVRPDDSQVGSQRSHSLLSPTTRSRGHSLVSAARIAAHNVAV